MAAPKTTPTTAKKADPVTLRLGYFPNVTHASAIAGIEKGIFADNLGPNVDLKTSIFNAGGAATEALFSGAIDATFIGPSPSINAFAKSKGEAIRVIAGATSGGAALVVKPEINSAADLKGKKVATPQLGNTQDVAARAWFLSQGLKTDTQGGGDVGIKPQDNSQTLDTFKQGLISGAWVPEPWATRLVKEGGGKVLVDERSLWPGGQFVTTQLIVSTSFLKAHPDVVENLLRGHIAATDWVNANPAEAQDVVNAGIAKVTGQAMNVDIIKASWGSMMFTFDPLASTLHKEAEDAKKVGLLSSDTNLDGIYDLSILNKLLTAAGKPPVSDHSSPPRRGHAEGGPRGAAFLAFQRIAMGWRFRSEHAVVVGRTGGAGGTDRACRAGAERAEAARAGPAPGRAAVAGDLGRRLRLVVAAVLVEHLTGHVGDVDGGSGPGDPGHDGDRGRGSRGHVTQGADDVAGRRAARTLAGRGRDELGAIGQLVTDLGRDGDSRAAVGDGDRPADVVAGVGGVAVGGVGHAEVGRPGAAAADVGRRGGRVVSAVGVVLPAHDRRRVVDRAGPHGVDGDGHGGVAAALEGAERALHVLLGQRTDALRGAALNEADAAGQLVGEVHVGGRRRPGVGHRELVVELLALGRRVGRRRGRQLEVSGRAPVGRTDGGPEPAPEPAGAGHRRRVAVGVPGGSDRPGRRRPR